jgi:peptide/nickel transport system substrate-binding protein
VIARRAVLAGGAALAIPHIARAQATSTLRFVPQANLAGLASLDPIYSPQYVTRNAAMLVWDTLYGVDANLVPRPQMCAGHDMSQDGLVWTFTLRPGLRFHDATPVLARDAVASLQRWMARDSNGQTIAAILLAIEALDDTRLRIRLSAPFPRLLFALGKMNTPVAFIMPERIARTDPFKPISDYVGSGPMLLRADEWVPASRAVFERFPLYVPRDEPGSWMAGGKRMMVERVEWTIMPDPTTAADALMTGAVDWLQSVLPDLAPLLRRRPDLRVDFANPLGNIGALRFNHLYPPFNDVRARRAIQMAINQADYMQAIVGNEAALWQKQPGFFTPGTAFSPDAAGAAPAGPGRFDDARHLIAETGYRGEPIILLAAGDVPITRMQADVTNALLMRLGMNVDYQTTDLTARRTRKDSPAQGGWHIFHTWHEGADCIDPLPYVALRTNGDKAWFGWPSDRAIEALIARWYAAREAADARVLLRQIDDASTAFVTFVPTGFFRSHQAWRSALPGVTAAPFPIFWGVGSPA